MSWYLAIYLCMPMAGELQCVPIYREAQASEQVCNDAGDPVSTRVMTDLSMAGYIVQMTGWKCFPMGDAL